MYEFLNIIVFLLLTGYAFKLMFSNPTYFKLSKTEKVLLTGREKFLLLTMVTGMVQVGFDMGINLSAFRLMLWMMMIVLAFILYEKPLKLNSLVLVYLTFLIWMAISLTWSTDLTYGTRAYLKYFYPLLIMLFASTFVQSTAFIYIAMKWMLLSSVVYSLFLGGIATDILGTRIFYGEGVFWTYSTLNDFLSIMSGVSFLMWWRTKEKKYLLLITWFVLSAILQSVRTGMLATVIVLMVASYLRYKKYAIPYIAMAIFLAISSVAFIPQVKEKMFYDATKITSISDLTSVSTSDINSNARFAMWEWALKKFHSGNEWTGSGLGSVQQYMYDHYVFGGLHVLHNDYLQIISDVGWIGLLLYLLFPISLFIYASKNMPQDGLNHLKSALLLAILSYVAVLTAMMTDNAVNYSFAVHSYPFIFIGIALAYKRNEKQNA